MQSIIRFSMFGNFERFSTNNLDAYMKLINFFGQKGYKPATANELQLQPNGQARVIIMPNFFNESGAIVEITSNRINFQKTLNSVSEISLLNEEFTNEFTDLLNTFIIDFGIISNRVALNCDIIKDDTESIMPTQSSYFDNTTNTEMSVRNVARKVIENEENNIIIEKYINKLDGFTKCSYDINSISENQMARFNHMNIRTMYDAYICIALEIEKGLK